MKTFNNCDDTYVYNFYKTIEEKDYKFLIKDYEKNYVFKNKELELTEQEENILIDLFDKINKEITIKNLNSNVILNKRLELDIKYDELKYEVLKSILDLYETTGEVGVLSILNEYYIVFDENKDINTQIKFVINTIKHLKNKIKLKKIKYANSNKSKNNNENILKSIRRRAVYLSLHLKLGSMIDIKKTTLTDWFILNDISQENQKENVKA